MAEPDISAIIEDATYAITQLEKEKVEAELKLIDLAEQISTTSLPDRSERVMRDLSPEERKAVIDQYADYEQLRSAQSGTQTRLDFVKKELKNWRDRLTKARE